MTILITSGALSGVIVLERSVASDSMSTQLLSISFSICSRSANFPFASTLYVGETMRRDTRVEHHEQHRERVTVSIQMMEIILVLMESRFIERYLIKVLKRVNYTQ